MNDKLPISAYKGADVVEIAINLLGKQLWTNFDNSLTGGLIVEVEAYCGATDQACHAYPDKLTPRTKTMYQAGGVAYVYLVYGMHHLFNIVTNVEGRADAVLIRAIEPTHGEETMKLRRQQIDSNKLLTGGPARLSQAMGISVADNNTDLQSDNIWLTEGKQFSKEEIIRSTRIGVEYAGEDALLPWRFHIKGNKYVSK
ncbi:MAG: DNA-3-methyladenine glycosylase [Bacteroidetes bacterium]|nr:MAG: DNA-3-methyladenine glycosylase [Bacteroidota bacterium]